MLILDIVKRALAELENQFFLYHSSEDLYMVVRAAQPGDPSIWSVEGGAEFGPATEDETRAWLIQQALDLVTEELLSLPRFVQDDAWEEFLAQPGKSIEALADAIGLMTEHQP